MRAIDCPCGHRFEAADDDELFRLCREHVDDEQIWTRVQDAYDVATGA